VTAARAAGPALLLALLAGCAGVPKGGYYQDDGPPEAPPPDLLLIPEPVPREEPLSATGNKPYHIAGHSYTPLPEAAGYRERGVASWYGKKFHGRRTSSGEPYDMYRLTAAHRTLPLPSYARVRNLTNGKTLIVRVNDRGPFHDNRLMDLSYAAAVRLGVLGSGTALVEVEGLPARDPAPPPPVAVAGGEPPRLYLQIGAFASRQNAETLRTRLERDDLRPVEIHAARNGPGELYRVRLGPLASVEDSDRLAARVSASGLGEARVVVE
jgi:rare lipoprotein A